MSGVYQGSIWHLGDVGKETIFIVDILKGTFIDIFGILPSSSSPLDTERRKVWQYLTGMQPPTRKAKISSHIWEKKFKIENLNFKKKLCLKTSSHNLEKKTKDKASLKKK